MINGGLIAAKIKFKAWNHHEVGRNSSLIIMPLFVIFVYPRHYVIFPIKEQYKTKAMI